MEAFLGTAFFVDGNGIFLTAAHVASEFETLDVWLCVKPNPVDDPYKNEWARVVSYENAPSGFDVAVGKVAYRTTRYFDTMGRAASIWREVSACGYPESTLIRGGTKFGMPLRGVRGHIQRTIESVPNFESPLPGKNFELSFPIAKGMSGCPLFGTSANELQLLGICVGNTVSELIDYEHLEVSDAGQRYSERKVRVEEHGVAIAIESLSEWKPALLSGRTLATVLESAS
ncbi:MAG: trypsin-like peptidase domain-containing protein [Hyphomonas sp.]|nr:trypsin-like peptidase domain-containing protein [Hyphomonas sp.]